MSPRVTAIHPLCAIEGGRITLEGSGFPVGRPSLPEVHVGGVSARVVYASAAQLSVIVPSGLPSGRTEVGLAAAPGDTASVDIARATCT
jgi:uncharacterized protein (TIGR03437 family)